MSQTTTYTKSVSNSYTQARAQYINDKIYEKFQALAYAGLLSNNKAESWANDLLYIMEMEVLDFFQLKFTLPNGEQKALEYKLIDNGNIYLDDRSGGINFRNLPSSTSVTLVVRRKKDAPNNAVVSKELERRGWGTGSMYKSEKSQHFKSFSKDGYGVEINKLGNW